MPLLQVKVYQVGIMKKILVSFFLLLSLASAQARNVFLVSVGIADYPGAVNDLFLPADDATAIYRLYVNHAGAKAVLLRDSSATRSEVLSSMRRLFSQAQEDDIVIFFFSGHGVRSGFVAYDEFLTYSDLKSVFSSCRARNKMIFADACYSGGLRDGRAHGSRDGLNQIMLFLSSRDNEVSIESPFMDNGFFTTALLGALKGGADFNRDRVITAIELFKAVSSKVSSLSFDSQHPVMWGSFPDNMPVMDWR